MQLNREMKINGNPFEMPESAEVDVPAVAISHSLKVVDSRYKLGFEMLNEVDYTIVTVKALSDETDLGSVVKK